MHPSATVRRAGLGDTDALFWSDNLSTCTQIIISGKSLPPSYLQWSLLTHNEDLETGAGVCESWLTLTTIWSILWTRAWSLSSKCLATLQYCHPFNCKVMLGAAPQNSIAVQWLTFLVTSLNHQLIWLDDFKLWCVLLFSVTEKQITINYY